MYISFNIERDFFFIVFASQRCISFHPTHIEIGEEDVQSEHRIKYSRRVRLGVRISYLEIIFALLFIYKICILLLYTFLS